MLVKPTKVDASTPFWYPISIDQRGVEIPLTNPDDAGLKSPVIIQKSQASSNSVLRTIVNVFETKQSPYRIVLRLRTAEKSVNYQCAVADSAEEAQRNYKYISDNIVSGLKVLDAADRETWALDKINALLGAGQGSADPEESSPDAAATRAFHSHFSLDERLVHFCSAAYGKSTNQGWLYLSANHACFYSFLFDRETKVKLELKDVERLKREKSKGFFNDAISVTTKNNNQHFFCNLLRRDETFDLLEDLVNRAMTRMLKTSANTKLEESPVGASAGDLHGASRKDQLEERKANLQFQMIFSLPADETILESVYAVLVLPDDPTEMQAQGRLFLSSGGFLCFLVCRTA
jgi:hypothetical protein